MKSPHHGFQFRFRNDSDLRRLFLLDTYQKFIWTRKLRLFFEGETTIFQIIKVVWSTVSNLRYPFAKISERKHTCWFRTTYSCGSPSCSKKKLFLFHLNPGYSNTSKPVRCFSFGLSFEIQKIPHTCEAISGGMSDVPCNTFPLLSGRSLELAAC